jgi:hypothetical protein
MKTKFEINDSFVNKNILLLAATFLRNYADRLENDSCNDFEVPDHFTVADKKLMSDAYGDRYEGYEPALSNNACACRALATIITEYSKKNIEIV